MHARTCICDERERKKNVFFSSLVRCLFFSFHQQQMQRRSTLLVADADLPQHNGDHGSSSKAPQRLPRRRVRWQTTEAKPTNVEEPTEFTSRINDAFGVMSVSVKSLRDYQELVEANAVAPGLASLPAARVLELSKRFLCSDAERKRRSVSLQ